MFKQDNRNNFNSKTQVSEILISTRKIFDFVVLLFSAYYLVGCSSSKKVDLFKSSFLISAHSDHQVTFQPIQPRREISFFVTGSRECLSQASGIKLVVISEQSSSEVGSVIVDVKNIKDKNSNEILSVLDFTPSDADSFSAHLNLVPKDYDSQTDNQDEEDRECNLDLEIVQHGVDDSQKESSEDKDNISSLDQSVSETPEDSDAATSLIKPCSQASDLDSLKTSLQSNNLSQLQSAVNQGKNLYLLLKSYEECSSEKAELAIALRSAWTNLNYHDSQRHYDICAIGCVIPMDGNAGGCISQCEQERSNRINQGLQTISNFLSN